MAGTLDLYGSAYGHFSSPAEASVRRETYGEDIGQTSWMTADEWLRFADAAGVGPESEVLEIGSGSGGPALYLAESRRCRVTGVDINEVGIGNARRLAHARGLADRVEFRAHDADGSLPFGAASFDAIISNDTMCHVTNRAGALREWHRVLRPGSRALFTDALVLTGPVSNEEIALRTAIGSYLVMPPGENERLLRRAGFELISVEDVTASAAAIAERRHDARDRHRARLIEQEGAERFAGLQRYLECVRLLAEERRLSRFAYLAAKPGDASASAPSK